MAITSAQISELRERTGAGIVDCKKALQESDGDITKATEILRQKGIASAAKKAGKVAAEGAVIAKIEGNKGVVVELNSQTDFVAKNEKFQNLLNEIVQVALKSGVKNLNELKTQKVSSCESIEEFVALKSAEIGEKLDLRRFISFVAEGDQLIGSYTHPVGSRIAVLVKLSGKQEQTAKDIAMHIAASIPSPEFISRDEIPAEVIENEKRIELGKEDLANKPKEIAEKIVVGRVDKALMEKVLLEQAYVKNPTQKIKDFLGAQNTQVLEFVRFNLGEGIEKQESNFADEVAAQMKG